MDVAKEDTKVIGVREEDAEERVRWKQKIRCGTANPEGKS